MYTRKCRVLIQHTQDATHDDARRTRALLCRPPQTIRTSSFGYAHERKSTCNENEHTFTYANTLRHNRRVQFLKKHTHETQRTKQKERADEWWKSEIRIGTRQLVILWSQVGTTPPIFLSSLCFFMLRIVIYCDLHHHISHRNDDDCPDLISTAIRRLCGLYNSRQHNQHTTLAFAFSSLTRVHSKLAQ